MSCPLNCEHLIEARKHEKMQQVDPAEIPNKDIRVTEEFLQSNDPLVGFLSSSLFIGAMQVESATDRDVREALEALIKTYRTRQSGLIYETKPENPYAAAIQEFVTQRMAEFAEKVQREVGMTTFRDSDFLGVLVFLERVALHWNNGRSRGRAFVSFLGAQSAARMAQFRQQEAESAEPGLIVE